MLRELRYIEDWRQKRGYSQEYIARRLDVSARTYWRWVNEDVVVEDLSGASIAKIRRLYREIRRERSQTFPGQSIEGRSVWELAIWLDSGRAIKAKLTERDAQLLAEELGIRKLVGGVARKGSFTFERIRRG